MSLTDQNFPHNFSPKLISTELMSMSNSLPFFPPRVPGLLASRSLFVRDNGDPHTMSMKPMALEFSQLALTLELEERAKIMKALRQNNKEMENI